MLSQLLTGNNERNESQEGKSRSTRLGEKKGSSGSSQRQNRPAKKAWEGEYKSFLSRVGWIKYRGQSSPNSNVDSQTKRSRSSDSEQDDNDESFPGPPKEPSTRGGAFGSIFGGRQSQPSTNAGGGEDDLDCSRHTAASSSSYTSSFISSSPSVRNPQFGSRSLPNQGMRRSVSFGNTDQANDVSFLSLDSIKEELSASRNGQKPLRPPTNSEPSTAAIKVPKPNIERKLSANSLTSASSSDFDENDMRKLADGGHGAQLPTVIYEPDYDNGDNDDNGDNVPTPKIHNMYSKDYSSSNSIDDGKQTPLPPLTGSNTTSRSSSGNQINPSTSPTSGTSGTSGVMKPPPIQTKKFFPSSFIPDPISDRTTITEPNSAPFIDHNNEKAVKGGNIFGALFAKSNTSTPVSKQDSPLTPMSQQEDLGVGVMSPMRVPLPPSAARPVSKSITMSTSLPNLRNAHPPTQTFPYQADMARPPPRGANNSSPLNNRVVTSSPSNSSTTAPVQVPDDKTLRAAFTEFHNSQQFGQDSTSAFLGDELSVHHQNNFGSFFQNGTPTDSSGMIISSSMTSFSSSLQSLDEHNPTLLPSSSACYPLFLPVEDVDSWDDLQPTSGERSSTSPTKRRQNSKIAQTNNFILPAVMYRSSNLCPTAFKSYPRGDFFQPIGRRPKNANGSLDVPPPPPLNSRGDPGAPPSPPRKPGGDEPTLSSSPDFGYYDEANDNTSPPTSPRSAAKVSKSIRGPFNPISLGHVYMSPVIVITTINVTNDLQSRHLTIHQNYLFEYDAVNNHVPLGFAHLEGCKLHQLDAISFDISFLSGKGEAHSVKVRCSSEEQCKMICEEIKFASNLKIDDLYEVDMDEEEDVLGKGRFACVKKTKRVNDDRECAIKIIDKESFWARVAAGRERKDTLVRELTIQAALTHFAMDHQQSFRPVFVKLYGVFETQKHLVIEMECMTGKPGDLFQLLKQRNSKLDEEEASQFIFNILWAVKSMLSVGIAHRDIKLANLLLTGDEFERKNGVLVKVGDYGMSNFVDPYNGLLHGRCGTPGYVAPEILRAGKNQGYRNSVDLFSLGVVMYTLLCGYEPFYGESDAELVKCNKKAQIVFDEDWEGVSEEAKDLICRMCEPDPEKRIGAEEALKSKWFTECKFGHDILIKEAGKAGAAETCTVM